MTEIAPVPAQVSRAIRVTLFEDRAEVVRAGRVELRAGAQWVALGGVSPFVDDRSVQAKVAGERATVLAARVRRKLHHEPALGREAIEALENEEKAARARAQDAGKAHERAMQELQRADQLAVSWAKAVSGVPRKACEPATLQSWREAYDAIDGSSATAMSAAGAARAAILRAEDEAGRAALRLREGLIQKPRWEATVEVQLRSDDVRAVEIEATYRVPCALWRPEHLARLTASDPREPRLGTVDVVTYATAWQRTGETWENVEVRFSTARPARAATPPALTPDVLASRKKTDEERKQVVIEAHEQAVALAGLGRGTRQVDEMPGVDDGGVPRTYAPSAKVSIPSDGRPFRVEVARAVAKAEIARVLYPELASVAHVRATATHPGPEPLLAGPVRLVRGGSLVGRARLDFVGAGEPFELGFGADDGVRVRREHAEERETAMLTGAQKIKRTVTVYLSNLSGDARRVLVTDRLPVSEIADVQIVPGDVHEWKSDPKDGFLKAEIDLAPRATRTIKFAYEVRAGAKVRLPF